MATKYATGKKAVSLCDRCSKKILLRRLRELIIKGKKTGLLVCPDCWDPDHPQLFLGTFPVNDPQALRTPRPDIGVVESRNTEWGWRPVGGGSDLARAGTPNPLVAVGSVGTVTVVTS